jgi:hypothetical protein
VHSNSGRSGPVSTVRTATLSERSLLAAAAGGVWCLPGMFHSDEAHHSTECRRVELSTLKPMPSADSELSFLSAVSRRFARQACHLPQPTGVHEL